MVGIFSLALFIITIVVIDERRANGWAEIAKMLTKTE